MCIEEDDDDDDNEAFDDFGMMTVMFMDEGSK